MLNILIGQDDYSLGQALEEIKKDLGDPAMLSANTVTLEGQVSLDQLKNACETVPFFAEKRLVVIRGLLERFDPPRQSSRQKQAAPSEQKQKETKSLIACLTNTPPSTTVVLFYGKAEAKNTLFKELSGKARVKSLALLTGRELNVWVQQKVTKEGGSISPPAAELLARLIGGNLRVMSSEIEKLVLYAEGRRIEADDVKKIVGYVQQADVFSMVDAIVDFKVEQAEQLLERLLQQGASPAYLLFMLERQVHLIARARELLDQKKTRAEIQSRLGGSEFVARKATQQAVRYTLPRLKQVYHQLLETDLAIKTGKYTNEIALNILVAELCHRVGVGE